MPTENLTRDEAAARARLLDVQDTIVHLDLTRGEETFGVTAEITFACAEPGVASFLDATCVDVGEVLLNGEALDLDDVVEETRIVLPRLAEQNTVRVVATMPYKHEGKGLHRFVDPGDDRVYLHSQFEPFDAHLVYPCFDQPDLKTTFTLAVDAPADWVVVSNELVEDRPAAGTAGTWRFATTPRLSTYFTALVAGQYREYRHDATSPAVDGRELPMAVYCRHSLASSVEKDLDELVEVTHQGLAWMSDAFGHAYPFSKYDQLFVPEFSAGAMENPGCITFSESFVFRSKVTDTRHERRGEVVLHEMAHMWFGDLVTMRWWDDLWLNESFATFMALLSQAEATRWTNAWVTFGDAEKAWALRQDQLPTTHPVAADMHDILSVHQNFDGITYAKGASVLRQLVAWVGQEEFLDGCKAYFREHAWGNATLADFLGTLEDASGRELTSWSREWLETTGVNTLRPELEVAEDGTYAEVAVLQEATEDHPTLRRHRIAVGVYDSTDAGLVRRERVELDVDGPRTVVTDLAGVRAGDVVLCNDDDLTFCKLRFDAASAEVLTEQLHRLTDPLARALAWASAWDALRDGELPTGTFLELVRNNVAHEDEVGVLERLLARARAAVDRYGDQRRRAARLAALAAEARAQVEGAAPGSDTQHAWVRHWVSCARHDDHVAEVGRFLDGTLTFDGVTLDTDLRWHVVLQLASVGAADEAVIDAELERDPTDLGERNAASARAARPDEEAKDAAWTRLMEEEGLSHTMGRQLWTGLLQLHQEDVLAGYDERYFRALEDVWAHRSIDWALEWSEGCFPHPLASPGLQERVQAHLAREDVPGPLRRVLLEQLDTLQRTLRARRVDADA